jgi:hypothetical protein
MQMNNQSLSTLSNAKVTTMSSSPLGAEIFGNSVFRKTQRGYAEIAQETQTLHPRLRRFLVFVDGIRTLDQLVELTQVLGSARDALGELYRDGFISMVGAADMTQPSMQAPLQQPYVNVSAFPGNMVPPPPSPMPSMQPQMQPMQQYPQMQPMQQPMQQPMMQPSQQPMPAPQPAQRSGYLAMDQIKNLMVSDLKTRMGKDADLVAPKIFAAGSPEDLIVMMMRLRDILTKYSNADVAEQFVKKFKDMLI